MTTEIANYDDLLAQMARAAQKAADIERPSGANISVRAGLLQYNGAAVPGNKLDVIIASSMHVNLYYEGKFDPQNITSPVCFAYSPDGENMAPHPASSKPQGDNCKTCPMNQWESDPDGGRGKACKNVRSLALIPAGIKAEQAPTAEVAILKLPVMSVKNWQTYVQMCKAVHGRPTYGVVTEIGTVPDAKSQFKITFADKGLVELPIIAGILPRMEDIDAMLQHVYEAPPAPSAEDEAKAKKAKKF